MANATKTRASGINLQAIGQCAVLSIKFAKRLHTEASFAENREDLALKRATCLAFAVSQTITGIHDCAETGFPTPTFVLTRTAFELSARALWAARTPDGWLRLEKTWTDSDCKALKDICSREPAGSPLRTLFDDRVTRLSEFDTVKQAPKMPDILEDIDKANAEAGGPSGIMSWRFLYPRVYSSFSSYVHGTFRKALFDNVDEHLPLVSATCVVATFGLYHVAEALIRKWLDGEKEHFDLLMEALKVSVAKPMSDGKQAD